MSPLPSLHRTICGIDAGEWNELAGDSAFATHGWLLTVERSWRENVQPLYFTLEREGRLIAGSVCYLVAATRRMETLDDMLLGRIAGVARAIGVSFLPALVCGPLLGYGWHIGVHPALTADEARQARCQILDAIEMEANDRRMPICFAQVLDDQHELKAMLQERGHLRCRNVPVNMLPLKWKSFQQYLGDLPRKRRAEFQRQINRNRDAGCAIEISKNPADAEDRLLQLLDRNSQKHNGRPFAGGTGFFRELSRNTGSDARVFTARKDGSITGVSVVLVRNDAAFIVAVGVDPEATRNDYTYFLITYYRPIAMAIECGLSRYYLGRGMDEIKVRRGCHLTDTWTYVRQSGTRRIASAAWFAVASQWNRYKLPAEARRALRDATASRSALEESA